jgi:hypothetical protein
MQCLKGIILKKRSGLMQVKLLNTGQRFWVKSTPTSRTQRPVLIAWDYVRNEPRSVLTEEDWYVLAGNRSSENGDFSFPSFEEVGEGDPVDFCIDTAHLPADIWWAEDGVEVGDDGDFSDPLIDGSEVGVTDGHHNNY